MMISVREADRLLALHVRRLPVVTRPLDEAAGEVLAEDIRADRPLPPYDRVAMDGIAVRWMPEVPGCYVVEGEQRAGQPQVELRAADGCVEVMTGAVLPHGADCVVRVEDTVTVAGGVALRAGATLHPGMNVHRCGSDRSEGALLVEAGRRLTAAHIGIAAAVGRTTLRVCARPRIAILSTGDELVAPDAAPLGHQVRRSNGAAVRAALAGHGFRAVVERHVADDASLLRDAVAALLPDVDVLLLSGGVSAGRFDFVPGVLAGLGVACHFHGIRQKPGKPVWFGTAPDGTIVFGLPGNPVSALVCTYRYVLPALRRASGDVPAVAPQAALEQDAPAPRAHGTLFVPVRVRLHAGRLLATPLATNGSGDFCALGNADGFVEVWAGMFAAGSITDFYDWRT